MLKFQLVSKHLYPVSGENSERIKSKSIIRRKSNSFYNFYKSIYSRFSILYPKCNEVNNLYTAANQDFYFICDVTNKSRSAYKNNIVLSDFDLFNIVFQNLAIRIIS